MPKDKPAAAPAAAARSQTSNSTGCAYRAPTCEWLATEGGSTVGLLATVHEGGIL